jgi:hypothetical protein
MPDNDTPAVDLDALEALCVRRSALVDEYHAALRGEYTIKARREAAEIDHRIDNLNADLGTYTPALIALVRTLQSENAALRAAITRDAHR